MVSNKDSLIKTFEPIAEAYSFCYIFLYRISVDLLIPVKRSTSL